MDQPQFMPFPEMLLQDNVKVEEPVSMENQAPMSRLLEKTYEMEFKKLGELVTTVSFTRITLFHLFQSIESCGHCLIYTDLTVRRLCRYV